MANELLERRGRALGTGAPLFYREPLHIVRGDGVYLFDDAGKRYVDMYNNVPCVGHANPRVVEAMSSQQAMLNVHSRYLHEGILAFAERIADLHDGDNMQSVVFSCTGTEANEVALRMARVATGQRGIICSDSAYHGNSEEVGKLTHTRRRNETAQSEIRGFPYPQMYRPLSETSEAELADQYLARVEEAIENLGRDGIGFAGMIVCPLFANEGLPNVPSGFMTRAAALVRAAGGLVISDEVQAGYCRTGRWWGYEVADFEPDIVVTGKPMGAGLPLAATTASRDLVETFRKGTGYFNTFASSPLQAAVGTAVLDVIEDEGLRQNVAEVGAFVIDSLRELSGRYPVMGDVRGHGLFAGVEWVSDPETREPDRDGAVNVVNALKDKGFLTGAAGALGNVVKIRPPLVFNRDNADAFLAAFDEVVSELYG